MFTVVLQRYEAVWEKGFENKIHLENWEVGSPLSKTCKTGFTYENNERQFAKILDKPVVPIHFACNV